MSPAGGVGINLAIQDAVATANLLAEKLQRGPVHVDDLRTVQARREWPTRLIQAMQIFIHRRVVTGRSPGKKNNGLPFVPTYQLKAELPSAANLVVGCDLLGQLVAAPTDSPM
jgi:2-polyprenyl-6-methoxyphenol hydroxylase-like FAD-dependent oxidoreductase